jgi:uncharacterized alkaline shock family protein YloU
VPAGVEIAMAVEERMRACPGIAGLDPDGDLSTVGPGHRVRGVRVSAPAGDDGVVVSLEVVGLAGARLPEAAEAAREAVREIVAARGLEPGPVEVHVTDVAARALPPQRTPSAAPAPAATPGPAPAPSGTRAPAAQTVRIPVATPGGERIVLAITIAVEVERP